jgi:myo-inositol-1(or 4)-monophosphatase
MYRNFIQTVLENSSVIARANFGKVTGSSKGTDNNQVLTETDLEIGRYIVTEVQKRYPAFNVIDEEAGVINKSSKYTWVVDPIDGTSNFANGIPEYGILIGLLEEGTPIAGGIALPSFNEIYIAEKGQGALCNGSSIRVTEEQRLLSSLVAYGIDGHQEDPSITHKETALLADIILAIRNLRSSNSAYDYALVAKGAYGGYINKTSKIWDNVGPHIVLEEAGGIYTDFYGQPVDYSNPLSKASSNFSMCTAPPALHKQLQAILNHSSTP